MIQTSVKAYTLVIDGNNQIVYATNGPQQFVVGANNIANAHIAGTLVVGTGANNITINSTALYVRGVPITVGYTGSIGGLGFSGSQSVVPGPLGFSGSIGAGFVGSQSTVPGPLGNVGFVGSKGFTGFQGSAGIPGGFAGSVGFNGSKGDPGGFTGSQGDVGYQGSVGPIGPLGTGFTGSQGPSGLLYISAPSSSVIFNDGGSANGAVGLTYNKLTGQVRVGAATWPLSLYNFSILNGAISIVDPAGQGAITCCSRSSDWTNIIVNNSIASSVLSVHDRTVAGPTGIWGNYWQLIRTAGAYSPSTQQFGLEASFQNLGGSVVGDPFTINPSGLTTILRLDSGIGPATGNPVTAAIQIVPNGNMFNAGIVFGAGSLQALSGISHAIQLPTNNCLVWFGGAGTIEGVMTVDNSGVFQMSGVGGINLNGPVTVGPSPNSLAMGLNITQSANGTLSITPFEQYLNLINVTSDNANVGGGYNAFGVNYSVGGSNMQGVRSAATFTITQTAPSSPSNPWLTYVGAGFNCFVGGTGEGGSNTGTGSRGTYFGINPTTRSTATNVYELCGSEFDIFGSAAATQHYQLGSSVVGMFVNHGTSLDAAYEIHFGNSGGYGMNAPGPGWGFGLVAAELGNGFVPIANTGTFIGTHLETLTNIPVAYVMDMRKFLAANAQIIGTGYVLDPIGQPTFGAGAGTITATLAGGGSGGSSGAGISITNGGGGIGALGNMSWLFGGAYNNILAVSGYYGINFFTQNLPALSIDFNQNVTFNTLGFMRVVAANINFNVANHDTAVTIPLPAGVTRYIINTVRITKASASLTTATIGVFTAPAGGGYAVCLNQAITVSQTATDVLNNAMNIGTNGAGGTIAFNDPTIYIRVGTAQGSAATADIVFNIIPLS